MSHRRALVCVVGLAVLAGCTKRPLELNVNSDGGTTHGDMTSTPLSASFARCVETITPDNNAVYLTISGALGSLNVVQTGPSLSATYFDPPPDDITQALPFTLTASALGVLADAVELDQGFSGLCVMGPGDEGQFPATFGVGHAYLQYQAGTVLIAADGTLSGMSECGTASTHAIYTLTCDDATPPPEVSPAPASNAHLPSGMYLCSSDITSIVEVNGDTSIGGIGSSGLLMLSQHGSDLTFDYEGDPNLSGTLQLTVTSESTAIANGQQSVATICVGPLDQTSAPIPALPITAGALSVFGSQLSVTLTGIAGTDAPCPGTYLAATLTCAPM